MHMTGTTTFNSPWTLQFDRDGTEDFGVIVDAKGDELVRSRAFWLPESGDPIPPTLAALWLIDTAPEMLSALERAEFLMRRAGKGDHLAFRNLPSAAKQARNIIVAAKGRSL